MTGALLWAWRALQENREELAVLATFVGIIVASIVAVAALKQARTAARQAQTAAQQAQIARERHEAQTEADLQRRITENYTKAVEQLGSDKLQVRLGGIYTLERISRESAQDYWTVMETLTAFVRDTDLSRTEARVHTDEPQRPSKRGPPTDIQAVLTVIMRRSEANREREKREGWCLNFESTDFWGADLREAHLERAALDGAHLDGAHLDGAHLEEAFLRGTHLEKALLRGTHLERALLTEAHLDGAHLEGAHLEGATLFGAHLEKTALFRAHLEGATLFGAHLEGAFLGEAHLEGATLDVAHLEGAFLGEAHLEGATLLGAHLEGADLEGAKGLTQDQLESAIGDAETTLPVGLTRPARWDDDHLLRMFSPARGHDDAGDVVTGGHPGGRHGPSSRRVPGDPTGETAGEERKVGPNPLGGA